MSLPATILLLAIAYLVRRLVLPPSNFPKNIPTIPFYVAFIPIFTNLDQEQIFNRYFREKMERYGAVKVYFASRWNVLLSRPEYVVQVLRNNGTFEKSGNCEKIPHAVVLEYLGDNVISAGNARWKQYRKVITNSLLFPNTDSMDKHIASMIDAFEGEMKKSVSGVVCVPDLIQKCFLSCIGDCILGCDLNADTDELGVLGRVKYLKTQIFRPFFMNFPDLDKLPIPSRTRARVAVKEFKRLLRLKILEERDTENADRLGLCLARACEKGEITQKQFEDNAIITLVAGHENPEMLLVSVLYLLAKHTAVQTKLRESLQDLESFEAEELPYLQSVIFECLRMYPPLGQLVNRITRQDVWLGKDVFLPAGIYVGNNSFFTQRDRGYWKGADSFKPERWGSDEREITKNYALAKSRCELTAFHGRNRACLGEKFALLEVRKSVVAMMQKFEFTLDPEWRERITPVGPIWPVRLSLRLKMVGGERKEG